MTPLTNGHTLYHNSFLTFNMPALKGWHPGERSIRHKLGFDAIPATAQAYTWISGDLPREHAKFHSEKLYFLPLTTLDEQGRPWGSILCAKDGKQGFISVPRYNTTSVRTELRGIRFWIIWGVESGKWRGCSWRGLGWRLRPVEGISLRGRLLK
jgi:hypothetical protein